MGIPRQTSEQLSSAGYSRRSLCVDIARVPEHLEEYKLVLRPSGLNHSHEAIRCEYAFLAWKFVLWIHRVEPNTRFWVDLQTAFGDLLDWIFLLVMSFYLWQREHRIDNAQPASGTSICYGSKYDMIMTLPNAYGKKKKSIIAKYSPSNKLWVLQFRDSPLEVYALNNCTTILLPYHTIPYLMWIKQELF